MLLLRGYALSACPVPTSCLGTSLLFVIQIGTAASASGQLPLPTVLILYDPSETLDSSQDHRPEGLIFQDGKGLPEMDIKPWENVTRSSVFKRSLTGLVGAT
ncbi:hypothetical protein BGZ60DRAFT_260231 [Tricladium varicosporioides]|nr:hypothetical protein BGZ60DRAFT_260231 [Hymenoscyphus varicosporioides]